MLGLDLLITSLSKKILIFTETTGAYTPANTTGWGAPNTTIASATSATLQIYDNENASLGTLDLYTTGLPDAIDTSVTNTWPNSSYEETAFNFYQGRITNTALGYLSTEVIPDGVYTAVYTVVANGITYTKTKYFFHYETIKCCVEKQLTKIPDSECCCDSSEVTKALKMRALLDGTINAAKCYQKERFSRLLRILQKICSGSMCDCE